MRYYILTLLIIISHVSTAQITLPSFQAVQYKGGGLPTLTTTAISDIAIETATSGGNVTLAGSSSVIAKGICWSTSTAPTTALSTKTNDGTGTGSFSSSLTSLSPGVTYYVRAYATNGGGTAYGGQISFTTSALTIGSAYQGGKVAYILASGDAGYDPAVTHGFIVSTAVNVGQWQPSSSNLLSTSSAIGSGAANTATIFAARGAGTYAAALATDLVFNGYSDWYLPSLDELNKVYQNRTALSYSTSGSYWTSTQNDATTAWYINFATGSPTTRSTGTSWNAPYCRSF
ncbi:MAG: DUF1566 domain-containing protein [Flavitalea sp.]